MDAILENADIQIKMNNYTLKKPGDKKLQEMDKNERITEQPMV